MRFTWMSTATCQSHTLVGTPAVSALPPEMPTRSDSVLFFVCPSLFSFSFSVSVLTRATASFRKYLRERLFSKLTPSCASVHLIDPARPLEEYAKLLQEDVIDLACIGVGENGHLAFNVRSVWTTHALSERPFSDAVRRVGVT